MNSSMMVTDGYSSRHFSTEGVGQSPLWRQNPPVKANPPPSFGGRPLLWTEWLTYDSENITLPDMLVTVMFLEKSRKFPEKIP